jgi:hypothetical protein
MKKGLVFVILASLLLMSCPVWAIQGTATISAKDLYSLAQRKTYRLGLRGSMLSPTKDILVTKDSSFDFGLEFDAKLNENLDTGPRFGICSFKSNTGGYNASYSVLRFGYGGRIYVMYWGEYGSTHGFVNAYLNAEADYYTASKASEVTLNSPPSFAGLGGMVGGGVELAFGPNTGAFAEVDYQRTSIKSTDGQSLPLDGYIVAAGARLAFF